MPVLLAIARQIAAVGSGDRSCRRGDILAVLQQARLIAFDLHDEIIAGRFGDLEGFLAKVFWQCVASSVKTRSFKPMAPISACAAGISFYFSSMTSE